MLLTCQLDGNGFGASKEDFLSKICSSTKFIVSTIRLEKVLVSGLNLGRCSTTLALMRIYSVLKIFVRPACEGPGVVWVAVAS